MRPTTLQLPERAAKPRSTGITMVVDGGLPTRYFRDVVESGAEFLDFVKFGWGTALVTKDLSEKIAVLRERRGELLLRRHALREVRPPGSTGRLSRALPAVLLSSTSRFRTERST